MKNGVEKEIKKAIKIIEDIVYQENDLRTRQYLHIATNALQAITIPKWMDKRALKYISKSIKNIKDLKTK